MNNRSSRYKNAQTSRRSRRMTLTALASCVLFPCLAEAQDGGLSGDINGLRAALDQVYATMITNCSELIGVSQGIAAFAALWYIAGKVWEDIALARGVNMFRLLRPFGTGIAIMLFPAVIALINGIMQSTATGTAALFKDANQAVATLLQQKENAIKNSGDWQTYVGENGVGDLQKWEQLSGEADSGVFSGLANRVKFEMAKISYNMKNSVKIWLSETLQDLFEAAALCINLVRIFYLIILAILGPLAFGLSNFIGFQSILTYWLARYINVFLWLPIANILGSLLAQIQQVMIKQDIAQIAATGQTSFGPTDTAYIIFLVMAIVGYFTVPSIAGYIVRAGGHAAHVLGPRLPNSRAPSI